MPKSDAICLAATKNCDFAASMPVVPLSGSNQLPSETDLVLLAGLKSLRGSPSKASKGGPVFIALSLRRTPRVDVLGLSTFSF